MWKYLFLSVLLNFGYTLNAQTSTTKKPFRVGIVGLVHEHVHWILGYDKKEDIEIVGIAEPNRELAENYSRQHGYSMSIVYSSMEEMITRTKPDAVLAFNSIYDHLKVVEYCAPKGIHVMVEKPLAVSVEHANRMIALAAQHNIFLLTNYETSWYGSNEKAFSMVNNDGMLGDIRKIVFRTGHPGPKEIGCHPEFLAWLTDPVLNGGGALTDFGCYGANLGTWLMKGQEPETVTAITQQIKPELYPKVEDEATILLTYKKTQVIIEASWNWPFGRKDMEVYGKTGYLFCKNAIEMQYRGNEKQAMTDLVAPVLPAERGDPFIYFANVVRGKIKMDTYDLSGTANNAIVVKILEAAKRSARSGKTIQWKEMYKSAEN